MCRYRRILLSVGCLLASLLCVRAGAQMQPSPPIMMMPSDSTVPPPSEAIFVPAGPAAAGAAAPPQGYATSPDPTPGNSCRTG